MKKIKASLLLFCLSFGLITGCDYSNQTPDDYVNSTVDPGLQEITE